MVATGLVCKTLKNNYFSFKHTISQRKIKIFFIFDSYCTYRTRKKYHKLRYQRPLQRLLSLRKLLGAQEPREREILISKNLITSDCQRADSFSN